MGEEVRTADRSTITTRIAGVAAAGLVAVIAVCLSIGAAAAVIGSVHGGVTDMQFRFGEGYSRSSGPNESGVRVQSISTIATVAVPGLSTLPVALHIVAGTLIALAPLTIAACAGLVGVGIWHGRPFAATVARGLLVSAAALLAVTIGGQLLAWASRVVAMGEFSRDYVDMFSRAPDFDPQLTATAIGLLIVALAFRLGANADRSTEGLV